MSYYTVLRSHHHSQLNKQLFLFLCPLHLYQNIKMPTPKIKGIKIGKLIGEGKKGKVYQCIDLIDNNVLKAVKIVGLLQMSPEQMQILTNLTYQGHVCIAKVYRVDDSRELRAIIMQKYWGTIRQHFLALKSNQGISFWQLLFSAIQQIMKALMAVRSKGYCHQDIHAGNILSDGICNFYLTDFSNIRDYTPQGEKRDVIQVLRLFLNMALIKCEPLEYHLSHNSDQTEAKAEQLKWINHVPRHPLCKIHDFFERIWSQPQLNLQALRINLLAFWPKAPQTEQDSGLQPVPQQSEQSLSSEKSKKRGRKVRKFSAQHDPKVRRSKMKRVKPSSKLWKAMKKRCKNVNEKTQWCCKCARAYKRLDKHKNLMHPEDNDPEKFRLMTMKFNQL